MHVGQLPNKVGLPQRDVHGTEGEYTQNGWAIHCRPQRPSRMPAMSTFRGEVKYPPYFVAPSACPCWSQALKPVSAVCALINSSICHKGVFVGFKYIRGCADRVLKHGFNQTALQIHRFAQAILAYSLPFKFPKFRWTSAANCRVPISSTSPDNWTC